MYISNQLNEGHAKIIYPYIAVVVVDSNVGPKCVAGGMACYEWYSAFVVQFKCYYRLLMDNHTIICL